MPGNPMGMFTMGRADRQALAAERRFFVPEVVQSSAMDCGPAALKSFLDGHGLPVSYGRLREACQTDVDGTSIDTIEEIAGQLGLPVDQIIVPKDHILLPEGRDRSRLASADLRQPERAIAV